MREEEKVTKNVYHVEDQLTHLQSLMWIHNSNFIYFEHILQRET